MPSRTFIDEWRKNEEERKQRGEKLPLYPLPPCPVEFFKKNGRTMCLNEFCSLHNDGSILSDTERQYNRPTKKSAYRTDYETLDDWLDDGKSFGDINKRLDENE